MGVVPLLKSNPKALAGAERSELMSIYEHYRSMSNEWLKRQIIHNNRIDILATAILGYEVRPFHLAMLQFQFQHPDSLQLAFRGAGKTTACTITKAIHLLLKDPNLRILISSKTSGNAESFLKEIKGHFEGNERLIEIFGEYYDPHQVIKWDNREIEVLPRTHSTKEASITCVGVESTVVSKHYDVLLSDDLVEEENSRTPYMREKVKTWYYQTLDPCLEPPDLNVEHRGEHHRLGTRYHFDDLYNHLITHELKDHHQVFQGLDEHDNTPWPEKYPPEWFKEKREKSGTIIFNAQYQCDTEAMKGEIFQYDDCQVIDQADVPKELQFYQGVDLAIAQNETSHQYASVVVATDKELNYYIFHAFAARLRFRDQVKRTQRDYREYDPVRAAVESNAYQAALYQELKDLDADMRVVPLFQSKDKITRAWKLSAIFEAKRMFFVRKGKELSTGLRKMVDQLILFPNYPLDDLFDGLDMAVAASRAKRRRRRREKVGLI